MFRVYVGNLPYSVRDAELKKYFEDAGCTVEEAVVVMEGEGRSKGFGFVSLADEASFEKAKALTGSDMNGRTLRIDAARPRTERNDRPARRDGDASARTAAPEAPKAEPTEEVVPMEESGETAEVAAMPAAAADEDSEEDDEEGDDDDDDSDDEDESDDDEEESDEDDK